MDVTLTPTLLHGWLAAALSADAGARASAERELQAAEEGAVPGLVGGLLDVVQAVGAVEEVRVRWWRVLCGSGAPCTIGADKTQAGRPPSNSSLTLATCESVAVSIAVTVAEK